MKIGNEIEEAIILAAGRSRRMEKLSGGKPKCLLEYEGETIIARLVRQLKENGVKKIVITTGFKAGIIKEMFSDDPTVILVENKYYEDDITVNSMKLALNQISDSCMIFESDIILEDDLIKHVLGSDFLGKSVWFTRGRLTNPQYGGILKSNKHGLVEDIRIVPIYNDKYKKYTKLSGIIRINQKDLTVCKDLINRYSVSTIKQYYFEPWIDNLELLKFEEGNISHYEIFTFNKPEQYYQVLSTKIGVKQVCPDYELVPIELLKDIEDHDKNRVEELINKIEKEEVWTQPLIVEKKYNMVLDGHHRLNAARKMKIKQLPVIYVNYEDVEVWSLRKEYRVSPKLVKNMVIDKGSIYPYKTVKHKYNFIVDKISIPLKDLKLD
jgi:choline kinase